MHKIQLIFICTTLFIAFSTIDGCSAPNKGKLFAPFTFVYTHIYMFGCVVYESWKIAALFLFLCVALFIRGLIADVRIFMLIWLASQCTRIEGTYTCIHSLVYNMCNEVWMWFFATFGVYLVFEVYGSAEKICRMSYASFDFDFIFLVFSLTNAVHVHCFKMRIIKVNSYILNKYS